MLKYWPEVVLAIAAAAGLVAYGGPAATSSDVSRFVFFGALAGLALALIIRWQPNRSEVTA